MTGEPHTSWFRRCSASDRRRPQTTHIARILAILVVITAEAQAEPATIAPLMPVFNNGVARSWPTAVSANGSIIAGYSTRQYGYASEACRWQGGTVVGLGDLPGYSDIWAGEPGSAAYGISPSGMIIAGSVNSPRGYEAALWSPWWHDWPADMGDLPGGDFYSVAKAVTDNMVFVGTSHSALGSEAFRWTDEGTMTGLGDLPGGAFDSTANAISADGSVIAGAGTSAAGHEAFLWRNGVMTGLGDLPGGAFGSEATAISLDGSTIVGMGTSAGGQEAFIYRNGVMTGLGDLPGGSYYSYPYSVSGDGSIVVGSSSGGGAFIWDSAHGMRCLRDVLMNDYHLDLTDWELDNATAISADGHTIVGVAFNRYISGWTIGYVVTMPEPGSLALLIIGAAMISKGRKRRV
ncbi:MAG TPA: PEP-CTERM sorting domain-containing protein [Phycisphaerae bacterium]|nr:PEP-CTERM sorting domain-containing protein [Phycisphaerae bacterium]